MTLFDLAYLTLAPVALPGIVYRRVFYGKYRESLPGMFGRQWQRSDHWAAGSLWVHAVSVGECMAAKALIPLLRKAFPELPCLLTTVTETGQAEARKLVPAQVDEVTFYPADLSWVVKRFLATYQPRLMVIMETELWPNALQLAAKSGTVIALANGRITEKSFRSYLRVRRFLREPLARIDAFCMQTNDDAQRIIALGAPPERVHVTGNCKFDIPYRPPSQERLEELRSMMHLSAEHPLIVVGSTHSGEEEIVLAAFRQVRASDPSVRLVLVPRHPERFEAVWQMLRRTEFRCLRVSDGARTDESSEGSPDVVLVDRMGLLVDLYALATVALVAGSFVPGIGGHNLLEAAIHGVPVVYGPYMEKQPELTRILSPENGGVIAPPQSLHAVLSDFLASPERCRHHGELARRAAMSQHGAASKTVDIIVQAYASRFGARRSQCLPDDVSKQSGA